MQKAKWPMEYQRMTQGYGFYYPDRTVRLDTLSHTASWAGDFGGQNTGVDPIYCPCDMIVNRVRLQANGEIYLQSLEEVLFADTTHGFLRLQLTHGENRHLKAGQILRQGEYVTSEGGWGGGNPYAFPNHIHIEAGKGKWKNTNQTQNAYGVWVIENQSPLHELFILGRDVEVLDDGGYDWVIDTPAEPTPDKTTEIFADKPDGSFLALYNINVRSAPGTDHDIIGMFAEGDIVEHYEDDGEWSRVKIDGVYGWIKSEPYAKEIA